QFGTHGVIVGKNRVARVNGCVGPDPRPAGGIITADSAETGQKTILWVFRIDAELGGETSVADILLLHRQRQSGGNADLLTDDVDASNLFGDGVLHLNPGVHLHEVETAVVIKQKLHG